MLSYNNSKSMNKLLALAGTPARTATRQNSKKPTYSFNKNGELVFENAPKDPESPYAQYKGANKKISDLAKSIAEEQAAMNLLIEEQRELRMALPAIIKANRVLHSYVVSKNASVLDVLNVFSDLRISGDMQTSRAIEVFNAFVSKHGYQLLHPNSDIGLADLELIRTGITASIGLKKKYSIKSYVEAVKQANAIENQIDEHAKSIANLNTEHDHLSKNNRPDIAFSVPMESVVNKKQQDVRKAGIDAQQIESDITRLSSQIKVIRDIKSLTSDQATKKAKELQAEVDNLRSKYSEYAKSLKEVQKNASSVTRVNNVLKLQQDALARKRAEKINQLQGQYARLPEKEAKKKIKAYMKAWEKNAQDELKIRNEKAGRVIDPGYVSGVTDTKSKMDETLKRIDELDSMLAPLKRFAGLTMEERLYESQKIEGLMSKKKEELRNATKKIARRQAVLDAELNSDLWEARIEKKLGEDARFAVHATKHMPLSYALIALHSGAEKRTKEMMRYAWEHFSPGRQTKLGHTLKQQLKIAPVHFGSKGFIVDPRYPKLNSQLVMMLDFGIKAVASVQDEAATTNMLLKAAMDAYRKTPEALAEHKEAYEQFFDEVAVWLKSKKAVFVLEEIVEELVADNKIETTGKKMNKKQLTEFTQNMVDLIRNAHALRKLASFVWPNYREEMHTWLRNSFRVVTTKKG